MLMGSAGLAMKTVIKNIDDHLLKPLGESLFQWNMQFNDDLEEIEGDLEIKPRGVATVMQKEVRQKIDCIASNCIKSYACTFYKDTKLNKRACNSTRY